MYGTIISGLRQQQRHGGGGDSNGNSSRGCSNDCRGAPTTALGVGADGIAFATAWKGCGCWLCWLCVGFCLLDVCVLHTPVVLLEAHAKKCIKNLANHGILGIARKLVMRQAKLLHLIKANL